MVLPIGFTARHNSLASTAQAHSPPLFGYVAHRPFVKHGAIDSQGVFKVNPPESVGFTVCVRDGLFEEIPICVAVNSPRMRAHSRSHSNLRTGLRASRTQRFLSSAVTAARFLLLPSGPALPIQETGSANSSSSVMYTRRGPGSMV